MFCTVDAAFRCTLCGRVYQGAILPIRVACLSFPRDPIEPTRIEPGGSCRHLGDLLRVVPCGLCGARSEPREVYACAVYGEVTLHATKGVKMCLGPLCTSWLASERPNE